MQLILKLLSRQTFKTLFLSSRTLAVRASVKKKLDVKQLNNLINFLLSSYRLSLALAL